MSISFVFVFKQLFIGRFYIKITLYIIVDHDVIFIKYEYIHTLFLCKKEQEKLPCKIKKPSTIF